MYYKFKHRNSHNSLYKLSELVFIPFVFCQQAHSKVCSNQYTCIPLYKNNEILFLKKLKLLCYTCIPYISVLRNDYPRLEIGFSISDSNSATFKTIVHGIIGGVPVPFPSSNGKITPPLPIKPDQKITYTNAIFVEPTYPKVSKTKNGTINQHSIAKHTPLPPMKIHPYRGKSENFGLLDTFLSALV